MSMKCVKNVPQITADGSGIGDSQGRGEGTRPTRLLLEGHLENAGAGAVKRLFWTNTHCVHKVVLEPRRWPWWKNTVKTWWSRAASSCRGRHSLSDVFGLRLARWGADAAKRHLQNIASASLPCHQCCISSSFLLFGGEIKGNLASVPHSFYRK